MIEAGAYCTFQRMLEIAFAQLILALAMCRLSLAALLALLDTPTALALQQLYGDLCLSTLHLLALFLLQMLATAASASSLVYPALHSTFVLVERQCCAPQVTFALPSR